MKTYLILTTLFNNKWFTVTRRISTILRIKPVIRCIYKVPSCSKSRASRKLSHICIGPATSISNHHMLSTSLEKIPIRWKILIRGIRRLVAHSRRPRERKITSMINRLLCFVIQKNRPCLADPVSGRLKWWGRKCTVYQTGNLHLKMANQRIKIQQPRSIFKIWTHKISYKLRTNSFKHFSLYWIIRRISKLITDSNNNYSKLSHS